jgi:hypothetical protein
MFQLVVHLPQVEATHDQCPFLIKFLRKLITFSQLKQRATIPGHGGHGWRSQHLKKPEQSSLKQDFS